MVEFDLNGLKAINDTHGHLAGDEVLKYFSYNLSEIIRASDTFARLGGDEFIAIFYTSDHTSIVNKLEDLLVYFKENPIIIEGREILCSFSYGIASFPEDGTSYNELISVADKNMYDYKKNFHRKVK
jgi:diguanylate cyclase (GGDEF)-like protein